MDALFYRGLAAELHERLSGRELRGVEDPALDARSPEGLLLRIAGEAGGLFVSLDRDCPGVFPSRAVAGKRTVRGVAQRLVARLRGAQVLGVGQPTVDRVLVLELKGAEGRLELWLEMTGRLGNLVLTDAAGAILVIGRAVLAGMSRMRRLEVGLPYVAAPAPKGEDLLEADRPGAELPEEPAALAKRFSGLTPRTAEALLALWQEQGLSPSEGLARLAAALRGEEPLAPLCLGPESWTAAPASLAPAGAPTFCEAAERAWLQREASLAAGRKRGALAGRIRAQLAQRERLLARLRAELAEAERGELLRVQAEHLAAHLHSVRRGQSELRVVRFDTGEELVVPLSPAQGPAENLDALFRRARKAERTRAVVQRRCDELAPEVLELRKLHSEAEAASGYAALAAIEQRLPPEPLPEELEQRRLPSGVSGYRSSDGLAILVGRTAAGNQTVTFQMARPRDLWFHTRDFPGSHVVLRRSGKREPPPRAVLEAAALAAHFSKAAAQLVVDVACCMRYQVRSPKGAPVGKVQYSGEKTLSVRMEPALLEPLLQRRLGIEA
jgi:predicted ribosome quality control (RQC) complex YloA/Tae2 family protein